jgi:hypothetical protein
MSKTAAIYPIVSALAKADDMLGLCAKWRSKDCTQERFLSDFFNPCRNEKIPEIESIASRSAEEINRFLAERGFSIALDPFQYPSDFGTASVLDVLVEWVQTGRLVSIRADHTRFEGVHLESVSFSKMIETVVARIPTKSGDDVCMAMYDDAPDGMDLIDLVNKIRADAKSCSDYEGIHFPMVNLDQRVDISWMKGLSTVGADGVPAIISQALQQTKLRMNEKGARAQSAVALGMMRCSVGPIPAPRPPLIINEPFLFWIERDGLQQPLFVAHLTRDDWKNPGDIHTKK